METLTVEAGEVQAGDEIWNSLASLWFRVKWIERIDNTTTILHTSGYDTWKHNREAVAIRRKGKQ